MTSPLVSSKNLEVLREKKLDRNGQQLIQVNDVVAAGQELDEEMMSKLSNMKVSNIKLKSSK